MNWLLMVIPAAGFLWWDHCLVKTLKQRLALLRMLECVQKVGGKPCYSILNKVHFSRHMWHLVTFRNPDKLYENNEPAHKVSAE